MLLLPQAPAFIPPPVAVPIAANAIVPFVPPAAAAAATGVAVAASAPLWLQLAVGAAAVGLVAAAVSQLWGAANQKRSETELTPDPAWLDVSVLKGQGDGTGRLKVSWIPDGSSVPAAEYDAGPDNGEVLIYRRFKTNTELFYWQGYTYEWKFFENGIEQHGCINPLVFGGCNGFDNPPSRGPLGSVSWGRRASPEAEFEPLQPVPYVPKPTPFGPPIPERLTETAPEPARPVPLPLVTPAPADPEPLTQPARAPGQATPARGPATAPLPLPLPNAQPGPGAGRPIQADGTLAPTTPTRPRPTPTGTHFPGGIPIPDRPPQPTMEGIAQEVGRIEQKVNKLLAPDDKNLFDYLDDFLDLVNAVAFIKDLLEPPIPGGEYVISSPCVLDESGNRIETAVSYSGGGHVLQAILGRIDGVADLLQAHKDLKQPICTHKGVGQPVQVNFVQVE